MKIKGINESKLVLKEVSYSILIRAVVLFAAALLITLNAKGNESSSTISLLLVGPTLMAASFMMAVFFFRNITIVFDKEKEILTRYIWRINKVKVESVRIDGLREISITPQNAGPSVFWQKTKYDLYLQFEDGSVKINYTSLSNKNSIKIAKALSEFFIVPFSKIENEGIIKTIASIKNSMK